MLLNKYDASVILAHKCASSTKCGAKLLLFIQLTKYFMYFCSKYLIHWSLNYKKKVEIMKKNHFKQLLPALLSMGMTFIVLGVLMLASSYIWNIKNNILLFAGLLFIVLGTIGYVYSIKQKP